MVLFSSPLCSALRALLCLLQLHQLARPMRNALYAAAAQACQSFLCCSCMCVQMCSAIHKDGLYRQLVFRCFSHPHYGITQSSTCSSVARSTVSPGGGGSMQLVPGRHSQPALQAPRCKRLAYAPAHNAGCVQRSTSLSCVHNPHPLIYACTKRVPRDKNLKGCCACSPGSPTCSSSARALVPAHARPDCRTQGDSQPAELHRPRLSELSLQAATADSQTSTLNARHRL